MRVFVPFVLDLCLWKEREKKGNQVTNEEGN